MKFTVRMTQVNHDTEDIKAMSIVTSYGATSEMGLQRVFLFASLCVAKIHAKTCSLKPLGHGKSDVSQVNFLRLLSYDRCSTRSHAQIEAAIAECGHGGITVFAPGEYNITRHVS